MSPVASTRWCPTPEQVMILEEMYRGGIRTPNAAQIQQITAHLSLYGKIEGKNVFYWFQNHKARDRQKLRKRLLGKQLQHHHQQHQHSTLQYSPPRNMNTNLNIGDHFQPHLVLQAAPPPTPPCCDLFHQPLLFSPPTYAAYRARNREDTFPRLTTRKAERTNTSYGREKTWPISIINDNDWTIIRDDHHPDVGPDARPLKTLELFPIKDKTSLKENHQPYDHLRLPIVSNYSNYTGH